jgi:hypothetical protein
MAGTKHDTCKTRYDLVDPEFEQGVAKVMTHGADVYGDRNWEEGILVRRLYAAARRHLDAFITGEDYDPDSELHHLYHCAACLMMMRKLATTDWDDRAWEVKHGKPKR